MVTIISVLLSVSPFRTRRVVPLATPVTGASYVTPSRMEVPEITTVPSVAWSVPPVRVLFVSCTVPPSAVMVWPVFVTLALVKISVLPTAIRLPLFVTVSEAAGSCRFLHGGSRC